MHISVIHSELLCEVLTYRVPETEDVKRLNKGFLRMVVEQNVRTWLLQIVRCCGLFPKHTSQASDIVQELDEIKRFYTNPTKVHERKIKSIGNWIAN